MLIALSPALFALRGAIAGASFLFALASVACLALALFLALFLPWQSSRMQRICILMRRLYMVCALVFTVSFAIAQSLIWHTAAQAQRQEPDADCLLVLGAGLFQGEIPSHVLQNRLQAAADYMQAHPQSVAVLSGGQGPNENVTEAYAMQSWLVNRGIAKERLYMEGLSTSTYENIAFSLPLIRELGYGEALIVTNDFHLLRASLISAHYGLPAQLLGAPTPKIFLIPATYYIREYFALGKAWLLLNLFRGSLP
jgi:uncharacterized SAM-binding protein YcdF (DUF218 family)